MNRSRYLVGALVLVAVFLAPQLLRASEGITLEELPKIVESLLQGHNDLKSRVAALETRSAPVATKTVRPTPNRTVTAQARATIRAERANATATVRFRNQQRARVTATAQANATATAQANSGPSAVEVEMWKKSTRPVTEVVATSLLEIARLFEIPGYVASGDVIYLKTLLWQIQLAYEDALAIVSPSSLSHVHEVFLRAMGYCNSGAGYTLSALEDSDASDLENAILAFDECGYSMERATQMLEAMQR